MARSAKQVLVALQVFGGLPQPHLRGAYVGLRHMDVGAHRAGARLRQRQVGLGGGQVRLRLVYGDAVLGVVDQQQGIPLLHPGIIGHAHGPDIPRHAGDGRHGVGLYLGVIGGLVRLRVTQRPEAEKGRRQHHQPDDDAGQDGLLLRRRLRGGRRGRGSGAFGGGSHSS